MSTTTPDPTGGESNEALDWAMLNLPGPVATEAAALRRRLRGSHVADAARARYARRYYGRRWSRAEQARHRHAERRRLAAQIEAIAALLMSDVRPGDLDEARELARRALAQVSKVS